MPDEGTSKEQVPLTGDVEPAGAGEWITLDEAGRRLGIDRKAVYRRIRRGTMVGKKAPRASHLLVWFPEEGEHGSQPAEEQRSLVGPDQAERVALAIEASIGRALSPLHEAIDKQQARIEELVRENERLRLEEERRSRELEEERERNQGRRWWHNLLG